MNGTSLDGDEPDLQVLLQHAQSTELTERGSIWQSIRPLGVDYGQGYAIGRPVPLEEVLDVLVGGTMARPIQKQTA